MELTKSLLIETIPNIDVSVRPTSCECVVYLMKAYGVDGVSANKKFLRTTPHNKLNKLKNK